MNWTLILQGLGILAGSGAAFTFVQFLITRKDNKFEKKVIERFDKLDKKIDTVDRKVDDTAAKQARARILRFSDELQTGRKFSKDSFNQTFSDISDYETHCKKYKDFQNSQANAAITNVIKVHAELLEQERKGEDVFL